MHGPNLFLEKARIHRLEPRQTLRTLDLSKNLNLIKIKQAGAELGQAQPELELRLS